MNRSNKEQEALIDLKDVAIGYAQKPIAENINWQVLPGSLWGIIGPNGAGKTTLLRTILGMIKPLDGKLHRRMKLRFGYVKQRDTLHDIYPFTVMEIVMTGRYGLTPDPGHPGIADYDAVEKAILETGISELKEAPIGELSGGQRQRVLIARALAAQPDIIVLDEPTNDMDIAGEEAVLNLIMDTHKQTGAAVIIVSHLLHAVLRIAENIIFIKDAEHGVYSKARFIKERHLERFYDMPISITEHANGQYSIIPSPERSTNHV